MHRTARRARGLGLGVLGLLLLLPLGVATRADDAPGPEPQRRDDQASVAAEALRVLRVRLEAQLRTAELLREMGRLEEALATCREVELLYGEGLARIEGLLRQAAAKPAPPAGRPVAVEEARPILPPPAPGRLSAAVEGGLRWLAAHQSANGSWEAAGFRRWCDGALRGPGPDGVVSSGPDGVGKPVYDVGVTGLALLAFLGAGVTPRSPSPFAKCVERGLLHLRTVQDAEGCFGPRTSQHFIYNHATAALAVIEAYALTESPALKVSAQRAVDFTQAAQNPYLGWRYGVRPGDNDTSVTGWMVMVLASARASNQAAARQGRPVPFEIQGTALDGARAWVEKMTDPESGRVGYNQRGGMPARPQDLVDAFPSERSEAMTAAGMLIRLHAGADPQGDAALRKGAALLAQRLPVWHETDGSIDMYYWYFGTLAAFQMGGSLWASWRHALEGAALESQRQDTDPCLYQGSWDPAGPWGPDGGRVYATALMTLICEVQERAARVAGDR